MKKYSTFTNTQNEIVPEDKTGYHLFQRLYFNEGDIIKGYQYSPDGKTYDSLKA